MNTNSLPEKDYVLVFKIIEQLAGCRKRADLIDLLQEEVLTLLEASSCFYCFTDPDLSQVKVLDSVNIPESCFPSLQEMVSYDLLGPGIAKSLRPVMAYDVDFPREQIQISKERFFKEKPHYLPAYKQYWCRLSSSMGALNLPELSVGIGIHRLTPNNHPFTVREVRLLELLRPSLMQTIRSLVLSEELNRYRSFADSLANINTPITLVYPDWQVIYQNSAFEQLLTKTKYPRLPNELIVSLERELACYSSKNSNRSNLEIPFYRLNNRTYRPTLTKINNNSERDFLWMLRMERAVDEYSKLLRRLNALGLTAREVEISILFRNGKGAKEIASRLCISYHTVRNHRVKIFAKTGVSTNSQLIVFLNQ